MSNSKLIKSKIKTVGSIKKMTRAMEMIARTKMKRAIDTALWARPYAVYARELLINITRKEYITHPLLQYGKGEKTLVVLVASDRGLCGGYNTNLYRAFSKLVHDERLCEVIAVGRRAEIMVRKHECSCVALHKRLPDVLLPEIIEDIAETVRERFMTGEYKTVRVIYTNFVSAMKQHVVMRTILPITAETLATLIEGAGNEEGIDLDRITTTNLPLYTLEPSREEVLDHIAPLLVSTEVYQSLLEARASEESMRMFAMKNATDSASKMQDKLWVSFNKTRQAGITREIAEISAGADALQM